MQYMKPRQIAETLDIHINTVWRRLAEMKPYVGKEYPTTALIADDGFYRVDFEAFCDFCNRRGELCNHDR